MGFYQGKKVSLRGGEVKAERSYSVSVTPGRSWFGRRSAPPEQWNNRKSTIDKDHGGPFSIFDCSGKTSQEGSTRSRSGAPKAEQKSWWSGWFPSRGDGKDKEEAAPLPAPGTYYRPQRLNAPARGGDWKNPPVWPGPSKKARSRALKAAMVALLVGGLVVLRGRVTAALQDLAGFRLGQVKVTGLRFLTEEDVLSALALKPGMDMFGLDMAGAAKRVSALAWVERSYIERRLPQSLLVTVTERKPFALVDSGNLWAVDKSGRLLPPSSRLCGEDLPILSGVRVRAEDAGTTRAAEALGSGLDFLAYLRKEDPGLFADVSEVDVARPGALKVTFLDGVQAVFPPGAGEVEMRRMAAVLSDLSGKGLRAQNMDFRFRDQVVVRTR